MEGGSGSGGGSEKAGPSNAPVWHRAYEQVAATVLPGIVEEVGEKIPRKDFRVLRVSQLDANELDSQLATMLTAQVKQIWPQFHDKYEPEIQLLLQSVMYYLSVFKTGSTYGLQLMGLKYRDEVQHWANPVKGDDAFPTTFQRMGWWVGHIFVRYLWTRVHRVAQREQWSEAEVDREGRRVAAWKKRVVKLMEYCEKVFSILSLLNYLAFLSNGRYRSVVDRILCMRLVYVRKQMNRQVDFDFLNRQLVWQGFTEFILFLMPFISFQSIRGKLLRMLPLRRGNGEDELPAHICAICNSTTISTPHKTNCGHVYCYMCIKTAKMSDPSATCPRCGSVVETIQRVATL